MKRTTLITTCSQFIANLICTVYELIVSDACRTDCWHLRCMLKDMNDNLNPPVAVDLWLLH